MVKSFLSAFILLVLLNSCADNYESDLINVKTEFLRMSIDTKGSITSLSDLKTGRNYLNLDTLTSLLSIRIDGIIRSPVEARTNKDVITLSYINDIEANIRFREYSSYLSFELISLSQNSLIELIIWGPFITEINKIIGETVGVVRGEEFALGIQSLNIKTLGGYPWNESDRMPAFDFVTAGDPNNMHPDSEGSVLYRVEAAKPTNSGSSLQAYSRNRFEERVIEDFNHEKIVAPAYNDGGVIGSKIAFFGSPVEMALEVIGEIEVAEGLPHPIIDGKWGKESKDAAAAYIITNFTEETIDEAIQLTKKAGLKYLYHYGKTFENWGHFDLYKGEFPNGIEGLKNCVDKAEAEGIRMGTHFLSNFITTNDPYVTPIPDRRLAIVGTSFLTEDIADDSNEIPIESPEFFNQMKNNSLKTVRINDELIRYGSVSTESPWRLLDCQRGVFGTTVSGYKKGEQIVKLLDHAYKVFLTNAELTIEMSETMAEIYNQTGLRQISFDGLEGNRSTGLGTYGESLMPYTWYNSLSETVRDHLIIDASRTTHFFWHIYSRMNWGEPWYGGFRESQTEYRFKNQAYFKRNFMPGMLGWFKMTETTSVEDAEWLLTKSAGYDAGYAFVVAEDIVAKNGNSDIIFSLIGDWEKLRLSNSFTEIQKERMRQVDAEFSLSRISSDHWKLSEIESQIFNHKREEKQPGEPVFSTYEIINEGEKQALGLIITAQNCEASNITLEIDNYKKISIPVKLKNGQVLRYSSGNFAQLYDVNGNILDEIPLNPSDFLIDANRHTITFDSKFTDMGKDPHVKVEFRTIASVEEVSLKN